MVPFGWSGHPFSIDQRSRVEIIHSSQRAVRQDSEKEPEGSEMNDSEGALMLSSALSNPGHSESLAGGLVVIVWSCE